MYKESNQIMKTRQLIYKCRRCGETVYGGLIPSSWDEMENAIEHGDVPRRAFTDGKYRSWTMVMILPCETSTKLTKLSFGEATDAQTQFGVCDLIGISHEDDTDKFAF